jgi:DNA polymerase V
MMTLRTDASIAAVYGVERKERLARPLFLSGVSAGFPSPAEDYVDRALDLNELLIKHPAATFFVRVAGDSMVGAGIHHNDILIVDRSLEAASGRIVIAVVGGELTVKRLVHDKNGSRLVAENPNYPPIPLTEESGCEIWGVVTGLVHQF